MVAPAVPNFVGGGGRGVLNRVFISGRLAGRSTCEMDSISQSQMQQKISCMCLNVKWYRD